MTPPATDYPPVRASLLELAAYFTKLGCTAFGGPAAHIALMEADLVGQRRWLSRGQFLDLLAAANLIPGPTSTEVAIHVGFTHQGVRGAVVAGMCFIVPAFLMVLLISIAYVALGALPAVGALLYGITPVVVAIVIQAVYRLGLTAWRRPALVALGLAACCVALLTGLDTVFVLVGAGLVGMALWWVGQGKSHAALSLTCAPLALAPGAWLFQVSDASLVQLALFFLKVGSTLLGSGYLLVSYLENDLVHRYGWLTSQQLIDAIAVGQMTPGPVFTTAAFVGYVIRAGPAGEVGRGALGALVCAAAIFLPSFVLVILTSPLIARLRRSPLTGAFIDGVNAAVVGSIIATTWTLFQAAVLAPGQPSAFRLALGDLRIDLPAFVLLLLAALVLLRLPKVNSTYLIAAGALVGLLVHLIS